MVSNYIRNAKARTGHYVYTCVQEDGANGPRSTPYTRFADCLSAAKRCPYFRVFRQNEMEPMRERLPKRECASLAKQLKSLAG